MKRRTLNLGRLSLQKETLASMDSVQGGSWPQTSGMGGYSPTCGVSCGCTNYCTEGLFCQAYSANNTCWVRQQTTCY
ncbi:hypothetical protein [Spirosoma montaniterrae]|uniref:Uncharacterized protein n=1 Tax=Spirosoma montaniterrae TaxID=1178516 RepID=A0A1P9WYV2_9BACT|nr:hypothetical protein [Spirosoma montaniterrae]AQG80549.1 hypothetical protein AWR27_15185 [Spirosoma montaniterrae]